MRTGIKHITRGQRNLLIRMITVLSFSFLSGMPLVKAQTTSISKEYRVKAVFLFNFTQFVEWPSTAFSSPGAPFVIGILGDDPFGNSIDETIANEKVNGHPLVVQRYHDIKELRACHILFINSDDPDRIKEDLSAVAGRNTLTVSDGGNFLKIGGMIRFFTESNKIRLQINPDAAKGSELFISSKLLRVSDIFDPKSLPR